MCAAGDAPTTAHRRTDGDERADARSNRDDRANCRTDGDQRECECQRR